MLQIFIKISRKQMQLEVLNFLAFSVTGYQVLRSWVKTKIFKSVYLSNFGSFNADELNSTYLVWTFV